MHACMHHVVCVHECIPSLWFITAADACTDVHICINYIQCIIRIIFTCAGVCTVHVHVIMHLVHVYICTIVNC